MSSVAPTWTGDTGTPKQLVVCLSVVPLMLLMLCICILATLIHQRRRQTSSDFGGSGNSPAAPSGLDPASIQRLPMTVIAAKTEPEPESSSPSEECSVCISELRDGDKARILPPCGHTFHVQCIDSWLLSRPTCPLCRNAVVVPSAPVPAPPVSVIASTSADAAAVDLTRAPTAVPGPGPGPGPADVAIRIDADVAAVASCEGGEAVASAGTGTVAAALHG